MAADAPPPSTPLSRPPISTALIHSPGLLTCWLASRITLQSASTSCSPGTGGPLSSNAPQPERLSYPYDRVNILHRGSRRTRTPLRLLTHNGLGARVECDTRECHLRFNPSRKAIASSSTADDIAKEFWKPTQ